MENSNKKNGIFLGVVSVATLIVAIIGATFAFFSAQVTGDNQVEVTSYNFATTLSVSRIDNAQDGKLIPVTDEQIPNALKTAESLCKTTTGHAGCALYKLSFLNSGDAEITLNGEIRTLENGFSTAENNSNIGFIMATKDEGGETYTPADTTTFKSLPTTMYEEGVVPDLPATSTVAFAEGTKIPTGETATDLYVMVYLKDTGVKQDEDMGKTYKGQFVFSSGDGAGGKLTATFGA